jgi:hypothetical protein
LSQAHGWIVTREMERVKKEIGAISSSTRLSKTHSVKTCFWGGFSGKIGVVNVTLPPLSDRPSRQ